ncbi:SGNH/GDSL hydrolase family protein [Spirosoma soli]|uniref:SGNH/GDSL hydrolase family protein n=1 Tax=Spirosoma soli TaxID=1770529 RepID=A0ABW5M037_9BACT
MAKLTSSLIRLLFLGFLVVFVFFHSKLNVTFEYPYHDFLDNIYIRLAKICLLLLLLIEVMRVFYYGVIKNDKAPKWLSNLATLLLPLSALLVLLEIGFMFISQSHEGGLTLASHIWFERYWKPITAEGYRDVEHTDTLGKKKVLVVGDSFTAGHGLKEEDERYSNVLGQKLGSQNYVVYNLGISGSDTRDEFKRLQEFKVKPDVLVVQYFPNDIEKAAKDNGLLPAVSKPYGDVPGFLRVLFMNSYLLNFIYWQLPHTSEAPFSDYALKAYTTPAIINSHLRDLEQFVTYASERNIPLYVVMFPFSHNLEKTAQYTRPVVTFFRQHNVPVLEVGALIKDVDPNDRIVGRNDFHASAIVNQRVGEALYRMVTTNKQ